MILMAGYSIKCSSN